MKEELIKSGRRVGNTTRLVDNCVQVLFTEGYVICLDHYYQDRETVINLSKRMAKIVVGRLIEEHNLSVEKHFKVFQNKDLLFQIELLPEFFDAIKKVSK